MYCTVGLPYRNISQYSFWLIVATLMVTKVGIFFILSKVIFYNYTGKDGDVRTGISSKNKIRYD